MRERESDPFLDDRAYDEDIFFPEEDDDDDDRSTHREKETRVLLSS